MGIFVIGMFLGLVLASLALGFFVSWLTCKAGLIAPGKIRALGNTLTFVIIAAPFLYWSISIYIVGLLWAEECEERTGYIFYSSPPLDYVSIRNSPSSSDKRVWKYLAETDIRSIVVTDMRWTGLTDDEGRFVLRLAEANDPRCTAFYAYVAKKKLKTPFLGDYCISIEPLDITKRVFKQDEHYEKHRLYKWGSLEISETRTLLQSAVSNKVYAEYVRVLFRHPKPPHNFFAAFASKPGCKKMDALKNNRWASTSNLFHFAFSAQVRDEIEKSQARMSAHSQ